ncbi:MAG: tetratricopeptide repeat protein [Fimbriimonadales bacterium]
MRRPIDIGYDLWQQGRKADALRMFERAVSEDPREGRAHLYLAIALADQGDLNRAEKHFSQAIALNPRDGFTFYNWGVFLHQHGRLDEALRAYQTALHLDPTLVSAQNAIRSLLGGVGGQGATVAGAPPQSPAAGVPPQAPAAGSPTPAGGYGSPAPQPIRSTYSWLSSIGYLFAVMGICVPFAGLIGGITFGILALVQGDRRGVGVIVTSILLAIPGLWFWGGLALIWERM